AFHAFAANFLWEPSPALRWIEEGMAAHFETAIVEPAGVRPGPPPAAILQALREHRRGGPVLAIDAVVRSGAEACRPDDAGHARKPGAEAAHAWALAQFVRARLSERARLDACLSEMAGGLDPLDALERMFGRPRARLQSDFETYVDGLTGMRR
ncbi:MAG TPA: hypothetical protein VEJ18_06590, partial [Planctomycetota bacterium]|nr:hypothetical protein [Planctomycetota bacterium]